MAPFLEHAQRIRLPTSAVQGDHQLPAEPFAQRMRADERFELDDAGLDVAESNVELDSFLDGGEPQLGQPGNRRLRELLVGEVGEDVAPPQRLGVREEPDGSFGVVRSRCLRAADTSDSYWCRSTAVGASSRAYPPPRITTRSVAPSAPRSFDASA